MDEITNQFEGLNLGGGLIGPQRSPVDILRILHTMAPSQEDDSDTEESDVELQTMMDVLFRVCGLKEDGTAMQALKRAAICDVIALMSTPKEDFYKLRDGNNKILNVGYSNLLSLFCTYARSFQEEDGTIPWHELDKQEFNLFRMKYKDSEMEDSPSPPTSPSGSATKPPRPPAFRSWSTTSTVRWVPSDANTQSDPVGESSTNTSLPSDTPAE